VGLKPGIASVSTQTRLATFVVFTLGDSEYALPLDRILEVLRMVAVTPLPGAPASVAGVIDLRGRVIPVLDLRTRLDLPPLAHTLRTPILIARGGDRVVGLIADEVVEMLGVFEDDIDGPETLGRTTAAIDAVARADGRLIMILDLEAICGVLDGVAIPSGDHPDG
jgi:purine-binding chemotaxis protein CheW